MNIEHSSRYLNSRKKFLKNNPLLTQKVIRTLIKFKNKPSHPSLNLEKLVGSSVWSIRIDKRNRIFFRIVNKSTSILIDIGHHDKYKEY